jgi:hypothetical protein
MPDMSEAELHDAIVSRSRLRQVGRGPRPDRTGHKVLVLEARDRAGGRTYTSTFPGTDVVIDLGRNGSTHSGITSWPPR